MHDPDHLKRMIQGSNLLVTAREEGELIGFLRGFRITATDVLLLICRSKRFSEERSGA
ncbi:hypothetical protein [Algoriphagus boritolerans]|uniref:hypothetical protein n=1 Tax=Algoriphagus boritolerans TaxID=308111 RepID=UPI000A40CA19